MDSINQNIIDFESSLFKVYGDRANNWNVIYCRQAVALARQGFIVCISSHKCVRKELAKCDPDGFSVVTITPSPKLKKEWIARLKDRYSKDPSAKNLAALRNAEDSYDEDIKDIASDPNFSHIYLESTNYHLRSIINKLYKLFNSIDSRFYYRRTDVDSNS
jgi:hypothetical protein